jgi:hypothetical protein
MAKTNYNLAKRQKEAARKARQLKKQDRRQGRVGEAPAAEGETAPDVTGQPQIPPPEDKSSS